MFEYWDTPAVRALLGSEHGKYPYFRKLLRQHADESYTAGKAWGEIREAVGQMTTRRQWGQAVTRMKTHGQAGRLTMISEQWKLLQGQLANEIADVERKAGRELPDELKRVRELLRAGRRDAAKQKVGVLLHRFTGIPRLAEEIRELKDENHL